MSRYKQVKPMIPQQEGEQQVEQKQEVIETPYKQQYKPKTFKFKRQVTLSPPPPEALVRIAREFTPPPNPRSLSVALLGPPNAGKSSLINALVESTVSSVSRKAQTTRKETLGILTEGNTQIVFYDTPGVVPPSQRKQYGREISVTGWEAAKSTDVTLVIFDAIKRVGEQEVAILDALEKAHKEESSTSPKVLILNKMDICKPPFTALKKADRMGKSGIFTETFFISCLEGKCVDQLREFLIGKAKSVAEWDFPPDWKTPMSDVELVAEVIRGQIYLLMNKEVPHIISQKNVGWVVDKFGDLRITQELYVERNSQLRIVSKHALKTLGTGAQIELRKHFKRRVFLSLIVKVRKGPPDSDVGYRYAA